MTVSICNKRKKCENFVEKGDREVVFYECGSLNKLKKGKETEIELFNLNV